MVTDARDALITGLGLVSSLGDGADVHWSRLSGAGGDQGFVDESTFAPYPVHPMIELDYSMQIPRHGDQRQMGPWQRIGVHAAGLALADAGLKNEPELLDRTNIIVAAGNGERDTAADANILAALLGSSDPQLVLNKVLPRELRPTLYLGQQSQLLAGNISIVHNVTGTSRTYKGEEIAGASAAKNACQRIMSDEGDLFLIGGACNAEREDMLLILELGGKLWHGKFRSVWHRRGNGGGMVTGSLGAFLVLESRAHAEARGARPYAKLLGVSTGRCDRKPSASTMSGNDQFADLCGGLAKGPLAVLSGASGVEPAMSEELAFLEQLTGGGYETGVRAYGSKLGHSLEAQFPAGLALAALAARHGTFYPPFDNSGVEAPFAGDPTRILVTGWGHWRGEGLALVEATT